MDISTGDISRGDVSRAVAVLRAGGLVAIPTETVYGLAADAENEAAVRRVFAVKGRPADHPVIVHLATASAVDEGWAGTVPGSARTLAAACWPGPLTLLLPAGPRVGPWITGGRATVGLRVPAHPLTTAVLAAFGGGLAAPSANRFGRVSPTTAQHVLADLGDDVDLVLDGGACPVGVESTIVDCTTDPPQVLRPGAITPEQVRDLLGTPPAPASGPSRAAGMIAAHYAPRCPVLLAEAPGEAEALLAAHPGARLLDATTDPVQVARRLYADMRAADDDRVTALVVLLPPAAGLGHAIRDRLTKAAAGTPISRDPNGRAG